MAFDETNFAIIGNNGTAAPMLATYKTNDTKADINTSGYFNKLAGVLRVNDLIYAVVDMDGTKGAALCIVVSNDGTTVDVADGTDIATTDSD